MKKALLVLWALPVLCLAQYDTSTILGTVKDSTGSQVANAKVTLENTQTGVKQTSASDTAGNYLFLNLRIGSYRVIAELSGFKRAQSDPFTLVVNARQRVDLTLEIGNITESVTVSGAANQLETDSSDRGQVITREAIVNLPLNGRAYADLALLAPGVRKSNIANRDASFNVNGLRSALNNFMVDGVDNNAYGTSNQGFSNQIVQLNPDAVQEFKVQTNNFSAEYGRAGGAVINASVRSGTNEFHGSAWEYLRNTKLNAVGFFKPSTGKPVLVQNQFGGTFGGPIQKNKMFVFGDYEGFRRVERTLQFATMPSAQQRAGNFGIPVRNPFTGDIYSDGVIPPSAITPFARRVLGDLPAAIRPSALGALPSNNWDYLTPTTWQDDKGDIRYDHYISSKLNAFARYSHRLLNRVENSVIPGLSGGDANGYVRVLNQQMATGFNYNLSPTSLIDFRIAFSKFDGGKSALGGERKNMLAEYGIPGLPDKPEIGGGLTNQSIAGFTALGRQSSNPQFQNPYTVNPKVNFSKVLRRHSLKAGYEYQAIDTDILDFNPQYGQDNYNGQFSRPTTSPATNIYNLADFMFGARSAYSLNNAVVLNYRQRMHFAYLQDDFKVSSKLTLNLGVRYEFATPQYEAKNRLANFDPQTNSLIQAKPGSLYNRALVNPDFNNWAPRLGAAYQLTRRTVVRGGYGLAYIHFNRMGGENLLGYNGPSIVNLTINQLPTSPACVADQFRNCFRTTQQGYPAGLVEPSSFSTALTRTNYTPADYRTSYVQSYHFTVQRELANNLVLDVAYVGNRSTGLMILGDFNQARPNAVGENTVLINRRPITGYDYIQISYGGGFANYNSLQAKIEKRYANGLYLLNSFTWSKAIDNASGHLEAFNGDNSRINYRNLASEKGQGSYNQPLNNTTSFVYEVPFGKGRRFASNMGGALDAVLGGWRLNGIHIMQSGQPVNISYTAPAAFQVSGAPTYRPNYLGGDIYAPERNNQRFLNAAAFGAPNAQNVNDPTRPFGNLGRNVGRSEAIYQFDLGLHKSFSLRPERLRLEFRSELFNLFNTTNWGAPNANVSNANFGTITGYAYPAIPARQIQFALRLAF
ncbi:MAG: carboxypeptidase regulatory-like domain-containing protein [Bryobacteraceae bacterium]|nr:carboxypeptidase regulatory-like domain-containing protein [Bryobacteraceae bacterium]